MNDIDIKGLDNLIAKFDDISEAKGIEDSLNQACAVVIDAAIKKAPKDTGALRNSIQNRIEENNNGLVGIVFTPLEYAPYVEFGTGLFAEDKGRTKVPWKYKDAKGNWHSTSGQMPHPFLRPALEENTEKIKDILKGGLVND